MLSRHITLTVTAGLAIAGCTPAVDTAEEEAIRAVAASGLELSQRQDAAGVAGLFAEDGVVYWEDRPATSGVGAIEAFVTREFAENPSGEGDFAPDREDVQLPRGCRPRGIRTASARAEYDGVDTCADQTQSHPPSPHLHPLVLDPWPFTLFSNSPPTPWIRARAYDGGAKKISAARAGPGHPLVVSSAEATAIPAMTAANPRPTLSAVYSPARVQSPSRSNATVS
jgi:hypothetical protein